MSQVPEQAQQPTLVIEPSHGWAALSLSELWAQRHLLYFMLWRDVKARYRQTALGPVWYVLSPLMRMVVFSLIFGNLAELPSEDVPYPVFTYTALLPWELFAGAVQRSTGGLVNYLSVISKVYFPRLIVPISAALVGVVDFSISIFILLAMAWYFGYPPDARLLAVPLLVLYALLLGLAVGLWLATLAVRYRDVAQFVGYGLSFWMYLTPVAYSSELIPERWQLLYQLNPMYWVIEGHRWSVLGLGSQPTGAALVGLLLLPTLLVSGAYVFLRTERTIVDYQ